MLLRRLLAVAVVLIASSAIAADPSLYSALRWRSIGPFRGGRVVAVGGVPGEPEHFYFGSVNGGVWETTNAGRTWQPIFDSQPIGSIGAITVAPSNPKVIYVGSGEADMRSDIAQGNGMYKSTDGGKTWTHIGLEDSQQIGRVLVDPSNADIVFVAALGHPYGPNSERGVYRSTDGGKTWAKVLGPNSDTGAIDLAFEPGNSKTIYAALWQTRRTPWSIYPPSNGPGSGLFNSTDGGNTWKQLRTGLPEKPGRIGIAVAPSEPHRVYLVVDSEEAGGIYRSDDAGATWARTSSDARVWSRAWYFGGINVEPKNADVVYSVNINLHRSTDGGKTFAPVKGAPGGDDYHQLWIDPQNPDRRILGVDQGCVVSVDGGRTWSSWYNQPTAQFYHVITDNQFPYWVYGAQQDTGAARVPSHTNTYQGVGLENFRETTAGGESDNIAPDPKDPEIIYGGRVERLDTRTGQTQSVDPTLAYPANYRRTWTLPLVFSPRDPNVLYFANQRLFRTSDGGNHWDVISSDLTRENPGVPANLDPITAALTPGAGTRHGVIYAIAPSRVADGDIWVGTDDGQIWRTRDEGAHWQNVTPSALTAWSKVGIIETSHFDGETAYAAVDRHRLDDFRPYVYRTLDGGKTWTLVANGIAPRDFVNAVREDPKKKGLLYAATEHGMYVSFDDGEHWQSLQQNLPVTSVRDIDVHGDDLVIATHGRGFWIMDDVTALRQLDASVASASAFLYKPAVAIREMFAGFTGTPLPKDEPSAPNPPLGAYIDYVLKTPAASPVTLEIFDAKNTLVRRYSSSDPVPALDPSTLRTAPEWVRTPSTLGASVGMHRFVWPLRYAAPEALSNGSSWTDGVWAAPGSYTVVLTVDGKKMTQPLTVAPHPLARVPQGAYEEQFSFAKEIEAERAKLATVLEEAQKFSSDLAERKKSASAESAKSLGEIENRAGEISGIVPGSEAMWWLAPREGTLRFISSELDNLAGAVGSADAAPTADARASWAKLRAMADDMVKRWNEVKASVR